jgi:hypothetical protein
VIQCHRPNKRVVTVTDAGVDELTALAATGSKPLLVPSRSATESSVS